MLACMGRVAPRLWPAWALLLELAALSAVSAPARSPGRVVRDGSLGSGSLAVGPGQGATYLITPEMGEQHGGNLFHSFERFGIGKHETATFTGPDPVDGPQSVSNVISRVTGGELSEIDGTLRSTIPGADVWLLNPSGVVFGEGATLDVQGSFHAARPTSWGSRAATIASTPTALGRACSRRLRPQRSASYRGATARRLGSIAASLRSRMERHSSWSGAISR